MMVGITMTTTTMMTEVYLDLPKTERSRRVGPCPFLRAEWNIPDSVGS